MAFRIWRPAPKPVDVTLNLVETSSGIAVQAVDRAYGAKVQDGLLFYIDGNGVLRFPCVNKDLGFQLTWEGKIKYSKTVGL